VPASDRLPELLRQRALVAEHLAWLEREIAASTGGRLLPAEHAMPRDPMPVPPRPGAGLAAIPCLPAPHATVAEDAADEIIGQYRVAPDLLKTDVRRGCLLYFAGALGLIALGVGLLYFLFKLGR
jgi:hypothetical protein